MAKLPVEPAFTYATPKRAIQSVSKMNLSEKFGDVEVRFVLSKNSKGRYFPVFVGRMARVSASEIAENPSANKNKPKVGTRKTVDASH